MTLEKRVDLKEKRKIVRTSISRFTMSAALVSSFFLAACGTKEGADGSGGKNGGTKNSQSGGSSLGNGETDGLFWADADPMFDQAGLTGECRVDELQGPEVYGAKVKSLMTGLPLTTEELTDLQGDPEQLSTLVDKWMGLPEAEAVFTRFFMSAFQQTELDIETFYGPTTFEALPLTGFEGEISRNGTQDLGNHNFSEMFARTAWHFVESDEPWTNVLTTSRYMMTPAIMTWLAFRDDDVAADDGTTTSRTSDELDESLRYVINEANEPAVANLLDRTHPDFMKFYHANLAEEASTAGSDCQGFVPDVVEVVENGSSDMTPGWVVEIRRPRQDHQFEVFSRIWGRRYFVRHSDGCRGFRGGNEPLLQFNDFTNWRMIDVRQPQGAEEATRFYDLEHLRSTEELVLKSEQVGFMTSPGFQGTWLTNEDNSSRVTINQILIVALGASFDGAAVSDFSPESLDTEHAGPGTECYGCHQTLDPMRDFVRNSLTNFYGPQEDPERKATEAEFVFGGVHETGNGLRDLANILAGHPYFPRAWVQKLCFYANAEACEEGEEFERVVTAFVESDFSFRTLVRELFTSPMITGASCDGGKLAGASIARLSQFCHRLSKRLGADDLCALASIPGSESADQKRVRTAVDSVPDDSFSRAVVEPVTISNTSLFIRANREVTCTRVAQQAFDDGFRGQPREDVVAILVEEVMGLPASHPLHDSAVSVLDRHVDGAMEEGESERTALQSAFIVSCMSPSSAGVGF